MEEQKKYFVHPSSYIDENVEIGEGTKIWHFCHILKNTKIGKNCVLGQNVMAGPNVVIGNRCKIQNNVSVYEGVELGRRFLWSVNGFHQCDKPKSFYREKA